MTVTPRRTPVPSRKGKAERRDLYRVPNDRLVTDVFAQWQDGGDNPTLPDSDLGGRFADGTTAHLGEGAPIPPPQTIMTRRQHYADMMRRSDVAAGGEGRICHRLCTRSRPRCVSLDAAAKSSSSSAARSVRGVGS